MPKRMMDYFWALVVGLILLATAIAQGPGGRYQAPGEPSQVFTAGPMLPLAPREK